MGLLEEYKEAEFEVVLPESKESILEVEYTIYEWYYKCDNKIIPYHYSITIDLPHKIKNKVTHLGFLQKILCKIDKLSYKMIDRIPSTHINEFLNNLRVENLEKGNPTFNEDGILLSKHTIEIKESSSSTSTTSTTSTTSISIKSTSSALINLTPISSIPTKAKYVEINEFYFHLLAAKKDLQLAEKNRAAVKKCYESKKLLKPNNNIIQ